MAPPPRRVNPRPNSRIPVQHGWSTRRKLRLARTGALLFVLILIVWRCGSGDDSTSATTTTTIRTSTTVVSPIATTATATALTNALPQPRSLAAASIVDGHLIVAGGLSEKRTSTDTVWVLDPNAAPPSTTAAAGTADGGSTALPAPTHAAAAATLGGVALVIGGAKGTSAYDTVTAIDATGKVSKHGTLPGRRTEATAIAGTDGSSIYVVGGNDGSKPTNDVLRTTDGTHFETIATLAQPTNSPAVAMLGQTIWVMGGEFNRTLNNAIQRIDLGAAGTPATVAVSAPLPVALSRSSAFVLGGSVFLAGGRTADARSNQIYRIDPMSGAVTAAGVLPLPWSDAAVTVDRGVAYLVGGITTTPAKAASTGTAKTGTAKPAPPVAQPTRDIAKIVPNF